MFVKGESNEDGAYQKSIRTNILAQIQTKLAIFDPMLQQFKEHLDNHFPYLRNEPVLIAISGGIDSVVLTHICNELEIDFVLAHCNFKLRGNESDDDEKFVQELASSLGKKIRTTSFDTDTHAKNHKQSIQVAARELRYQWFQKVLEEHQLKYVLTAHNTNDNLETFIINLTRGSGLEGFTGIPPINGNIVRPLLAFSRDQITMFAIKTGIEWREDKSNASVKYIRNKVRHKILPVLQDINPNILDSFKKTLEHLNESQDMIDAEIQKVSENIITKDNLGILKMNIDEILKLSYPKAYLYQVLKKYGFTEWNDVVSLLSAQSGKQVFAKEYRLLKDRQFLMLTKTEATVSQNKVYEILETMDKIDIPISLHMQATKEKVIKSSVDILVDKDLLNFPLHVRKWGYGDYICPIGMQGTKKLSQLFKDRKLSLIDKENVWLLTDAMDTIIWVIGMRQDRRFSVSKSTKSILKITRS
ncbi:tRNA lysidine(34) synthetase TilS [Flavobacteriaceae bacterium S356]|uniref:tRNA(Ile)-lysidine synthase n=1 Tax=Asprobacillus argus TaxID=3076534 RepID=A0ABU3LCU0_9FLAO|nr:tRNA lysidine(34) synthetase TilS [Flavobacteriaceae bacterium S356]